MRQKRWISACLAALAVLTMASCGGQEDPKNLIPEKPDEERVVNLFSPMEKTDPNAENVARTAAGAQHQKHEHGQTG